MTRKQRELMLFIQRCERAPSVEEMRLATGNESKGNVGRMLECLEAQGYISRRRGCARSVTILRRVPERYEYLVWDDVAKALRPYRSAEAA